jgi:hypothetical protein
MFFLNIMSDNVEIECVDLFSDDSDDEYIVLEDSVYSSEGFIEGKVHFQILRQEESLAGWEVRLFFNILFSFFLFLGKNCHPLPPYTASIPSVHLNRFKLVLLSLHLQPRWHNHCCLLRPYVTQSSCSRFVWHRDTYIPSRLVCNKTANGILWRDPREQKKPSFFPSSFKTRRNFSLFHPWCLNPFIRIYNTLRQNPPRGRHCLQNCNPQFQRAFVDYINILGSHHCEDLIYSIGNSHKGFIPVKWPGWIFQFVPQINVHKKNDNSKRNI